MTSEPKDLVAHVCSLAMGFGVTGRADVKAEYETARQELRDHIASLEAALAPFADDKLPSSRKTEIAYNRWGLRCLMSKLELARDAAWRAARTSTPLDGEGR